MKNRPMTRADWKAALATVAKLKKKMLAKAQAHATLALPATEAPRVGRPKIRTAQQLRDRKSSKQRARRHAQRVGAVQAVERAEEQL